MNHKRVRLSFSNDREKSALLRAIDVLPDSTIAIKGQKKRLDAEVHYVRAGNYFVFTMLHKDYELLVPSEARKIGYDSLSRLVGFIFYNNLYFFKPKG